MNNNRKNKVINKIIDEIIVSDTNNKTDEEIKLFEDAINIKFLEIMNGMKCIKNQLNNLKLKVDELKQFLAEDKI